MNGNQVIIYLKTIAEIISLQTTYNGQGNCSPSVLDDIGVAPVLRVMGANSIINKPSQVGTSGLGPRLPASRLYAL